MNKRYNTLQLHAIAGNQGIGTTYTGSLTYEQFVSITDIADTQVDEFIKMQRDPTSSRVNGVTNYLVKRNDTILPNVTCVTTTLDFTPITSLPSLNDVSQVGLLTLPGNAKRMLVDGQGRRLGIEEALKVAAHLKSHTVDITFINTDTDSLADARDFIRQIFADFHKSVKKPHAAMNLFFDSAEESSKFINQAYNYLRNEQLKFDQLISVEGNTKKVFNLAHFKTFLTKFTGLSMANMNSLFAKPELAEKQQAMLEQIGSFIQYINQAPALKAIYAGAEPAEFKKDNLLCCAIGIEALGILGNQIINSAIARNKRVDWSVLEDISTIDFSKQNTLWHKKVVTPDGTMIRGSAPILAGVIASKLYIPLNEDFWAVA